MAKKRIYIRDDEGHAWYWANGRIKCVGDKTPDRGYFCDGLDEGVALLNQYGYITGGKKPHDDCFERGMIAALGVVEARQEDVLFDEIVESADEKALLRSARRNDDMEWSGLARYVKRKKGEA